MITVRVLPSAKLHSTLLPNCHGEVMDGGAVAAAAVGVILVRQRMMLEGPEPTAAPSFQRAEGREHCFVADVWPLVAVSMRAGPPWRGLELCSVRASPSQPVWLRGDPLSCP